MRLFLMISLLGISFLHLNAQSETEEAGVTTACMNYLEGFYEGDTVKLKNAIVPELLKFGYWKNKETGMYKSEGQMTYQAAVNYAKRVAEKKNFAKSDAPKSVKILDISNHTAAAKITAWWGTDYALLAKHDGKWMIEQVLWEGPLSRD
ncbi:MAG: nuclear transport factor 2 family protein [Saprospiraceae bacterium]